MMRVAALAYIVIIAAGAASAQSALPDRTRTPGALNPAVTQATIATTICIAGWTRTVRPPAAYTSSLKRRQLRPIGGRMADYEEDHLIALELGGAPADPRNLWPEPRAAANGWTADRKDGLERKLNRLVCDGQLPLAEAQRAVATDWTAAYRRYGAEETEARSAHRPAPVVHPAPGKGCQGGPLVWVNTRSGVYHYAGERWYGKTREGEFLCEKAALAEGDRPTGNGQ